MSEHEHLYRKLNDEAVYCRGCGEIKTAVQPVCTLPHYQPTWVYYPPVYPSPNTWPNWYPWWGTTTSEDFTNGNTYELGSITYTVEP